MQPVMQQPGPAHSQPFCAAPSQFWKPAAHDATVQVPAGQPAVACGSAQTWLQSPHWEGS
jgi:hypothetical protein